MSSPRWQYFRLNNRSHNTLFPGDELQSPDADGSIVAWASTPARAFAVADLTSAYPTRADRFRRGVALLDRARVLVQDEVETMKSATPLTWQMLTGAKIELDGRRATLTQNGRILRVEILTPDSARFSARPATPPTKAENQNEGITILSTRIETKQGTDARIAVLLTPVGEKWPELPAPALQHIGGVEMKKFDREKFQLPARSPPWGRSAASKSPVCGGAGILRATALGLLCTGWSQPARSRRTRKRLPR